MPEMKDSGIEWIGAVPINWGIFHYKYIVAAKVDNRGRTPEIDENDIGTPIIELDAIGDKYPNVMKASKFISKASYKKYIRNDLEVGDVLFGTVGSVGKSSIVPKGFNYCIAQNIVGYRFNGLQDSLFWYFYFQSEAFKQMYMQFNKGNIQSSIKISDMEQGSVCVPPLEEQKRISNFLDIKCSEIDSLVADIQSEIETLEEYKKSVITEAVTKGLNSDVKMKDSGIEWAAKVPEHWKIMANKYVMKKIKEISPKYSGEDILSLTMNGVIVRDLDAGGKMPATFNGYQRVYAGNLLMCLFDYDVTPRCIGLVKNNGLTSPAYSQFVMKNGNSAKYYYYYYLMIDNTKELLHLAKNLRHSFTEEQLGAINTPVPPIEEQVDIANYLDVKIEQIEQTIAMKQEQLAILEEYKKSVIYEYVTGKKEVPLS